MRNLFEQVSQHTLFNRFTRIFFLFFIFHDIQCFQCSSTTTENDVPILDSTNPYQEFTNTITLTNYGTLTGYGYYFWWKFVAYQQVNQTHTIDGKAVNATQTNGFLLLTLDDGLLYYKPLLMFIKMNQTTQIVTVVFHYQYNLALNASVYQRTFTFQGQSFEGVWMFGMVTFYPNEKKLILQVNKSYIQIILTTSVLSGSIRSVLGGEGYLYTIGDNSNSNNAYNLHSFKGKISQLFFIQSISQTDYVYKFLGTPCLTIAVSYSESTYKFIDGYKIYNDGYTDQHTVQLQGEKYIIKGWAKVNTSAVSQDCKMLLMRITINKAYQNQAYLGDKKFLIAYTINVQSTTNSSIQIQTQHYPVPDQAGSYNLSYVQYDQYNITGTNMLSLISQWHYIVFEHKNNASDTTNTCLYFYFYQQSMITQCFGTTNYRRQFQDALMYVYIGNDDYYVDTQFIGSLAYFSITSGYSTTQNNSLICHYSCLTCNGPTELNCLTCQANSNRQYLSDTLECRCLLGYIDIDNQLICQLLEDSHSSIVEKQVQYQQNNITQIIEFGYFQIILNSQQIIQQCPQYNDINYFCLDCYFNPSTWYLNPICTYDYIQLNNQLNYGYNSIQREQNDYDIYLISSDGQLQLYDQYAQICKTQTSNCYSIPYTHLGNQIFAQCKQNYYYLNGDCNQCSNNCQSCNNNEDCITCDDQYYLQNGYCYQCSSNCQTCQYSEDTNSVSCLTCPSKYNLLNGVCQQCGLNCAICQQDYDELNLVYFNRCLQCDDIKLYYISIDGQNCVKNKIAHCQYAFDYFRDDHYSYHLRIYTLDISFQPYNYSSTIKTACARCEDYYASFVSYSACVPINYMSTFLANTTAFNLSAVYTATQLYNSTCTFYLNGTFSTTCLIGTSAKQFTSTICLPYIDKCSSCMYSYTKLTYTCLQCYQSYYAHRMIGTCIKCPTELMCSTCVHQQKVNQDGWIYNIRIFYDWEANYQNDHDFTLYGQSTVKDDYEVVCQSCISGYTLQGSLCVQNCPSSCLLCVYEDGYNQCVKCPLDNQGRQMSIYNNECIKCSPNCELCRVRTDDEINSINPFFSNQDLFYFSNQCLQSFNEDSYFYNEYLGSFIDCNLSNSCENSFQISYNLYCDDQTYQSNLQNSTNTTQFQDQNKLFTDFLNDGFSEFYYYQFYKITNEKQISLIYITLNLIGDQSCNINTDSIITQQFSQNIFSAINVELIIQSKTQSEILLQNTLIIQNFTKVTLINLQFTFTTEKEVYLLFQSAAQQQIKLQQIIFQSTSNKTVGQYYLQLQDFSELILDQISFINIYDNSTQGLIYIPLNSKNTERTILIQNITILYSNFLSTNFLTIITSSNEILQLYNFNISANYISSYFLNTNQQIQGILKLQNIIFQQSSFISNTIVFQFQYFTQVQIDNLQFQTSTLDNSILIQLNQNLQSQNILFSNLTLIASKILINVNQEMSSQSFIFNYTTIQYCLYDQESKFITIYNYQTTNQILVFQNITLINNIVTNYDSFDLTKYTEAMIILESNSIYLSNININRAYGLPDFSLLNAQSIFIQNAYITLDENYKFKGIHQEQYCQLQQIKGKFYPLIFYIYSSKETIFDTLVINSLILYDSSAIIYESAALSVLQQTETLLINNTQIYNNLLLISQHQHSVNLIQITSSQVMNIDIYNTQFNKNILYEYTEDQSIISATLINSQCPNCYIIFNNASLSSNLVLNGQDSIIFIKSYSIIFQNVTFNLNGQFDYSLIQPHLLWSFTDSTTVYMEQINKLFYTEQIGGNGQFNSDIFTIQSSKFIQTNGYYGGAFKFTPLSSGNIQIINSSFINISSTFTESEYNYGGCIYIEASTQLNVEIYNSTFENIFAKDSGGILYLNSYSDSVNITFQNIIYKNIYALQGSLITAIFPQQASLSLLTLNNITIYQQIEFFYEFLQKFSSFETDFYNQIVNNRTFIYCKYSNVNLNQIQITQLIGEGLFVDNYLKSLYVNQMILSDILIPSNGFFNVQPLNNYNSSINLGIISLINLNTFQYPDFNCSYVTNSIISLTQTCNLNYLEAPLIINNQYSSIYQLENIYCLMSTLILYKNEYIPGIINTYSFKQYDTINIYNLQLTNISCSICQQGLLNIMYTDNDVQNSGIKLNDIILQNNTCGQYSCITITKGILKSSSINSRRILEVLNMEQALQNFEFEIMINSYQCLQNNADYGTCLITQNFNTYIKQTYLKNNQANYIGGSAVFIGSDINIIIEQSQIQQNQASIGGGLYFTDTIPPDFSQYGTQIEGNTASDYGNDQVQVPSKLSITLNNYESILSTIITYQTDEMIIEDIYIEPYQLIKGIISESILLPSAQAINEYQYFDWQNTQYISLNYTFRIVPLDSQYNRLKNLNNSYCTMEGRYQQLNSITETNTQFTTNFTSYTQVTYDTNTQDYNFDDLLIYFDPDEPQNIVLQFQIQCSSIKVPMFNKSAPYNYIGSHSNYFLRFNIKTFPCQLGEIKNETDSSCHQCDYIQDQYSVVKNAVKCEVKNSESTSEVKAAQLNLRSGYWRPYFDSPNIVYCINFEENCLGGWDTGDNTCYNGHIGALCEQCDIYNIRGNGSYSLSGPYLCGSCGQTQSNSLLISFVSIGTLVSIMLSVKGTKEMIDQFARQILTLGAIGSMMALNDNQSAVLIKILTNYFQITMSIATFQLKLPSVLDTTVSSLGNPIKQMTYSLDCFLAQIFPMEIHYARIIWQLLMPIMYIGIFLIFYFFAICFKFTRYNFSVISTTLIYMYIYLLPTLMNSLISIISYRDISGYKWILGNVAYLYNTYTHLKWLLGFCLPALILIGIFIPLIMLVSLRSIRTKLDNPSSRSAWGYLYNEYKREAYYWELIKIFQKELIIIALTYYEDFIVIKAILVYLVIFIYHWLTHSVQPYQSKKLNDIDKEQTDIASLSIIFGVGIYVAQSYQIEEILYPLYILLGVVNILFTIRIVIKIIFAFTTELHQKLDIARTILKTKFPGLLKYNFCKKLLRNETEAKQRAILNFQKIRRLVLPEVRWIVMFKKSNTKQKQLLKKQTTLHDLRRSQDFEKQIEQSSNPDEIQEEIDKQLSVKDIVFMEKQPGSSSFRTKQTYFGNNPSEINSPKDDHIELYKSINQQKTVHFSENDNEENESKDNFIFDKNYPITASIKPKQSIFSNQQRKMSGFSEMTSPKDIKDDKINLNRSNNPYKSVHFSGEESSQKSQTTQKQQYILNFFSNNQSEQNSLKEENKSTFFRQINPYKQINFSQNDEQLENECLSQDIQSNDNLKKENF